MLGSGMFGAVELFKFSLWILIFFGLIVSLNMLRIGVKRFAQGDRKLYLKDVLRETPMRESSGSLLILESIFGFIVCIAMFFGLQYWMS
jgi:hypothetical protein